VFTSPWPDWPVVILGVLAGAIPCQTIYPGYLAG
jgi:sulfite exporter TauE/SafE